MAMSHNDPATMLRNLPNSTSAAHTQRQHHRVCVTARRLRSALPVTLMLYPDRADEKEERKMGIMPKMKRDHTSRLACVMLGGLVSLVALSSAGRVALGAEFSYFKKGKDGVYEEIKKPPKNLKCKSHCLIYDKNRWRCATSDEEVDPQGRPAMGDDNTVRNMMTMSR